MRTVKIMMRKRKGITSRALAIFFLLFLALRSEMSHCKIGIEKPEYFKIRMSSDGLKPYDVKTHGLFHIVFYKHVLGRLLAVEQNFTLYRAFETGLLARFLPEDPVFLQLMGKAKMAKTITEKSSAIYNLSTHFHNKVYVVPVFQRRNCYFINLKKNNLSPMGMV